ncbi:MAG: hypothetical protein ACRDKW_04270, partial [Actinomycetota bacterium]
VGVIAAFDEVVLRGPQVVGVVLFGGVPEPAAFVVRGDVVVHGCRPQAAPAGGRRPHVAGSDEQRQQQADPERALAMTRSSILDPPGLFR